MSNELNRTIKRLKRYVPDASKGIGTDLFHFISSLTPIINVDLLIKRDDGAILLTWRDDQFYGPGWHIPGGVIRFKETIATRIHAVAKQELNAEISSDYLPIKVQEVMNHTRNTRGHFISLLFNCQLISELDEQTKFSPEHPANNQWKWHQSLPKDLIDVQSRIYGDLWKD